ncbi:MAG TPA: ABC transporter permease [Puia sp.]|jgi:ABC-type antimicrobial peptide transport system permease subunit|nr:ABC transporter permease [Puia sp.]
MEKEEIERAWARHLQRMEHRRRSRKPGPFHAFGNTGSMLRSYFRIAWRNLTRSMTFSLINIGGLAIGMASAILILLWIGNEFSYDNFQTKKDRIYLLENRGNYRGTVDVFAGVPQPLAPVLKTDYPQIEEVARINGTAPFTLTVGDRHFEGKGGMMTDPGFLKIFSFPLAKGNLETALNTPRSMVITESFAKQLFGSDDPMGKVVRIDSNNFAVTGVAKDPPRNTDLGFSYLIPYSYMKDAGWSNSGWKDFSATTIVLLKPGVTEQMADDRFRDILKMHADGIDNEIFLHPLAKWRLYSRFENGKIVGGGIEDVRLFGLLAAFILIIACINYMNLSTAQSVRRAREVGIRKVVGALRPSIVLRFLGESILISFLSGVLGLIIVQMSIQGFNWLTWDNLVVPYDDPYFWMGIAAFILVTGVIAGSYPAFYLSGFRPISVLKGTATRASMAKEPGRSSLRRAYGMISVRKILVVFQFSIAIAFIICTIVIYRQINYGRDRDPGYNRDHLVFAYVKGDMNKNYGLIRNDLLGSGAVTAVTRSNSPITYSWNSDDTYTWRGKNPGLRIPIEEYHADNDFLETMGIRLIAGRTINTYLYPTDTMAILLNQSAVKLMGFKDPIGQIVTNKQGNWTVIGIIKDFVVESPFNRLSPVIVQGPRNSFGAITFRLNPRYSTSDNMQKIQAIFRRYNPDYPFIYRFVTEADNEKLEGQRRTGIQSALFGGMAILISCLGLFALAAYTAESRIKEIGVRKVLGASITSIAALLSGGFLKLVAISFAIASPVAWWIMHSWLQSYPYHIAIGWLVFVITALVSLGIALTAVSYQAIRAAMANPVDSLRAE